MELEKIKRTSSSNRKASGSLLPPLESIYRKICKNCKSYAFFVMQFSYSPYGEVYATSGTNQTVFGFTGEPMDYDGLVNLRARYYNPALGVFPNLDLLEGGIQRPLSLNRYVYVVGNPVNHHDPSGQQCIPSVTRTEDCPASTTSTLVFGNNMYDVSLVDASGWTLISYDGSSLSAELTPLGDYNLPQGFNKVAIAQANGREIAITYDGGAETLRRPHFPVCLIFR